MSPRKMKTEEKRLARSIAFDRSILAQIDARAKNAMISRSSYVNIALDKILKMDVNNTRLLS